MAECPSCGDVLFGMTVEEAADHIADCGPASREIIAAYFDSRSETEGSK